MADHEENAIRAAIKALSQVVAPAVDPSNPLAVEQLRLVVQFLDFHLERRRLQGRFDWKELGLNVAFGEAVLAALAPAQASDAGALATLVAQGRVHLGQQLPAASERQPLSDAILAAIGDLVSQAQAMEPDARRRVEAVVLERSKESLTLKRSWFLPFGFESGAATVLKIEELLRDCPDV